jgi:hypothetical protein
LPVTVVDAFNREGLRTYLGAHGFEIVEAADEAPERPRLAVDAGAQTGVAITRWVPERAQHQ